MFSSIKTKVIIVYLLVFSVILISLTLFLYFALNKIIIKNIDSRLLSQAKALAIIIDVYNDKMNNDAAGKYVLSNEMLREYNFPGDNNFFFQIRYWDGKTIKKSLSLKDSDLPFSFSGQTNFETIIFNGKTIRKVDYYILEQNEGDRKEFGVIVQYAEYIEREINIIKEFKIILFLSILFLFLSSLLSSGFIANKVIIPINKMSETISRVSEKNLSERIEERNIPLELKNIASTFNRTMDILETSFNTQKKFIADASHELKTPLSVVMSQSEITLRKERGNEEYKEALFEILNATKIMSGTVQKLLTIASLSMDMTELNRGEIYINDIISKSVSLLNSMAEEKQVKINVSIHNRFKVMGDSDKLLELFVNLIDNAVKYNIPQGKIDISVKEEAQWLIVEITDTGVGIPEDDLTKVFDRFYRVDKSRSKSSGGSGLGLSICKEIVRLHNGKIEIKRLPAGGTSVMVYLLMSGKRSGVQSCAP